MLQLPGNFQTTTQGKKISPSKYLSRIVDDQDRHDAIIILTTDITDNEEELAKILEQLQKYRQLVDPNTRLVVVIIVMASRYFRTSILFSFMIAGLPFVACPPSILLTFTKVILCLMRWLGLMTGSSTISSTSFLEDSNTIINQY